MPRATSNWIFGSLASCGGSRWGREVGAMSVRDRLVENWGLVENRLKFDKKGWGGGKPTETGVVHSFPGFYRKFSFE